MEHSATDWGSEGEEGRVPGFRDLMPMEIIDPFGLTPETPQQNYHS